MQELETLSMPEKLQLVEDLWDSIARSRKDIPIPDWQKEELARRKEKYLQSPDSILPWAEVKKSILSSND
jgi:putative addiction module component (TIGR02574 family)